MTTAPLSNDEKILDLLPASRHEPAGFIGGWHCCAGSRFLIKNLIATHLTTPTHDCWTVEPAPDDVDEAAWTTLTIGPNPEGGAVFYRGDIIDRFIPSAIPGERDAHHMERSTSADYEGVETDRYPALINGGGATRYLADGSITIFRHRA